jgi:hypothetical protein
MYQLDTRLSSQLSVPHVTQDRSAWLAIGMLAAKRVDEHARVEEEAAQPVAQP